MNLFEATKLLQSVGYTVKEDPKWEKFDRLVESIVERIPEPEMLNEMSKKVQGAGPAALACLSLINSIDSKRSNFKSGKTKDTSIGDKVYAKYADAWEKLQAEIESQGADGEENYNPGDLKVYNMMIDGGYAEAIANDDINAVKTTNSTLSNLTVNTGMRIRDFMNPILLYIPVLPQRIYGNKIIKKIYYVKIKVFYWFVLKNTIGCIIKMPRRIKY